MSHPRWDKVLQEWRQSRRLRLAILVVGLVLGLHLVLLLSDRQQTLAKDFASQAGMLARLQDASREAAWPRRAAQAEQALTAERNTIPAVRSAGLAQAELQAWLTAQGATAGLQSGRATAETTLEVPGHPGLWQVIARLDAEVPPGGLEPLLVAISGGLPWIQVQQLDVTAGTPMRLSMIVRGYYRRDDAALGARAAGPMDAAAAVPFDAAVPAQPPVASPAQTQVPVP
ncbi:MAG: hypothetical protein ACOH1L_11055 [Thermomonas sp.]